MSKNPDKTPSSTPDKSPSRTPSASVESLQPGCSTLNVPMTRTAFGGYMATLPGGAKFHIAGGTAFVDGKHLAPKKPPMRTGPVKPGKSSGPRLLEPNTTRLSFRQPSGVKQTINVKLRHTSVTSKPVAFKMKMNRPGIYTIVPSHGIIDTDQTVNVVFELNSNYIDADYKIDNKGHEVHLLALKWPKKIDEYDYSKWNKLERARKEEEQRCVFKIDFLGKSGEDADKKKKEPICSGPTHIRITPTSISLSPPKAKACTITMKNLELGTVAYKMQTNRPKFYIIKPCKGLMKAGETITASVEVNKTVTKNDVENDHDSHQILLLALPWTINKSEFDGEEFLVMMTSNKRSLQRQTVCVDLSVQGADEFVGVIPSLISFKRPETHKGHGQIIPVKLVNNNDRAAAFQFSTSHSVMNRFYTALPGSGVVQPHSGFQCTVGLHPGFNLSDLPGDRQNHHFEVKAMYWPLPTFNQDLWDEFAESRKGDLQKTKLYIDYNGLDRCEGQLVVGGKPVLVSSQAGTRQSTQEWESGESAETNWIVKQKPKNVPAFVQQMMQKQMMQMGMEKPNKQSSSPPRSVANRSTPSTTSHAPKVSKSKSSTRSSSSSKKSKSKKSNKSKKSIPKKSKKKAESNVSERSEASISESSDSDSEGSESSEGSSDDEGSSGSEDQ